MRTAYADPDDDGQEEEGSPDAWFSGYVEGRDEAWANVHGALGRFAPFDPHGDPLLDEISITEALVSLAAQLEEVL